MKSELVERDQGTVLVVADDSDMLGILQPILAGRGYRVLVASGADSAARLLDLELGIDSVMIRAGLTDSERIELMCLRRGVGVLFLCGIVEAGVIRLRVPERRPECAPRILIVDGEPAVRGLFDRYLAEDGYHVTAVETCAQALAAAQKTTFDVIVVDLTLPDIDGIEAIRNFRNDFPSMKILAVSGDMAGCVPSLVLSAGATAILGKPATSWELREAVYRLLDPVGRWHAVTLSAEGFRAVSAEDGTQKTWGWESGRTVASLARFLM
jgi:DNA-binding response OmpR family regulator